MPKPNLAQMILLELEPFLSRGWIICAVLETEYPAILPAPTGNDCASHDTDNLMVIQFVAPHGDHTHLYTVVLIQPGISLRPEAFSKRLVEGLQMLDMQERSTVLEAGHA